jgi:hypothetical protein
MFLSTPALAQPRSAPQDRAELQQTKREARDDQRDRAQAATLLRRYDEAIAHRRGAALRMLDAEALRLMDAELAESKREVRQDAREVVRSEREAKDGRYAGGPPRRAETRDDRRDLRDDRRDLHVERKDLQHVRAIRADFAELRGRTQRASVLRKRTLLADFLARSRHELKQNAAELREDRHERREDWREARR